MSLRRHKHGVSIQSSINFGDTLLQITREWKTAETWFLARLFIYQSSIVSQILDLIHWMVTIFSFYHGLVKTENTMSVWNSRSGGKHHSLVSPGTGDFTHLHLHKKWMPRSSPMGGCGGFKWLVHYCMSRCRCKSKFFKCQAHADSIVCTSSVISSSCKWT